MKRKQHTHPGGRPPKFNEPSHPITVTLPDRVLDLLKAVDPDRAKAITKLVDASLDKERNHTRGLVELVKISATKSIILIAHSRSLQQIPWIRLIEVAPARNIISIFPGTPIEMLEVAISDLMEGLSPQEQTEKSMLEDLLKHLRLSRRGNKTSKEEILFIATGRAS